MRFKAYDICSLSDNSTEKVKISGDLFEKLNLFPRVSEGSENYAPLYMHEFKELILGTLAQSHHTVLTAFDENSDKDEIAIDADKINDKTYFYINKLESRLYIQGKLYPTTLSAGLTRDRLNKILSDCLGKIIVLIPASIEYTISDIQEIFSTSYVKKIIFKNMLGLKIPKGTTLHNPRKDLDESLAESWNTYSSETVDYLELRSKDDEQLSKNPIAKIGMTLSNENKAVQVFQSMEIIESGERVLIKPKGNESKIIYISKKTQDDPQETYEKILKKYIKDFKRFD